MKKQTKIAVMRRFPKKVFFRSLITAEAVPQRYHSEKGFWKYKANLQKNNHVERWFQKIRFARRPLGDCFRINKKSYLEISAVASRHQHRHGHRHCKNFIFALSIFWKKIEHLCSSFLCLSMASIPLCYKYLFLCDLLFIHPKGAHWYSKHPSIGVSKNNCSGNVCKIPSKTFSVESFFSPFADLPGRF